MLGDVFCVSKVVDNVLYVEVLEVIRCALFCMLEVIALYARGAGGYARLLEVLEIVLCVLETILCTGGSEGRTACIVGARGCVFRTEGAGGDTLCTTQHVKGCRGRT